MSENTVWRIQNENYLQITFCNVLPETDNQLQIHTPKLPTAGLSPPSATSDISSSAKKTSAKKRSTSEILGTHILFRIKV
jgi:hypothetical protein